MTATNTHPSFFNLFMISRLVMHHTMHINTHKRQQMYFIALDPLEPPSKVCSWNSVIEATGSGGIFPYVWWKDYDMKVKLYEGLAMIAT
ncbi:MAG: hypothetical protein ACOYL3_26705 [Desulfuromonadaceae bacterium]